MYVATIIIVLILAVCSLELVGKWFSFIGRRNNRAGGGSSENGGNGGSRRRSTGSGGGR